MGWALRWIPIEKVIDHLTAWLASTIKRPNSDEAQRVLRGVRILRNACDDFLEKVEF